MASKKVVYIEDDQDLINLVAKLLKPIGLQVVGALDGKTGLELINSLLPDLVLLDLMIPDMDGWEIYKRMSTNHSTANIPVVIITAKAQPIDQVIGKQIAKVDGYICKPFTPSELIECINQIFMES